MANTQRTQPQLPAKREDFAGTKYWQASADRRQQRLYVQLCLLAAAARDHFLAQEESKHGSRNWSATMSYYSLVHACRSIMFQCFGSFPTSHADMSAVLTCPQIGPQDDKWVSLDWLSRFTEHEGSKVAKEKVLIDQVRQVLQTYLLADLKSEPLHDRILQYGPLVEQCKGLRNDSSYEALLIAHEYHHEKVAEHAASLSKDLGSAAGLFLDLARDVFVAGMHTDPYYGQNRDDFRAFAAEYVGSRLWMTVQESLPAASLKPLMSWARSLHSTLTVAGRDVDSMWANLHHKVFTGKNALMGDYIQSVEKLGRELQRVQAWQQATSSTPQVQP